MRKIFLAAALGVFLAGCSGGSEQKTNSDQGGGSMAGAGGAGPGYDGTASGGGKYGTVPESSAGAPVDGNYRTLQTNAPSATNKAAPAAAPVPPTPGK
jgi:hypothetical protein